MKQFHLIILSLAVLVASSCSGNSNSMNSVPAGTITYAIPCKVTSINPEKEGKALLCIWLHGGVKDRKLHNLLDFNHLDCCDADERIADYLSRSGEKAIVLCPLCYRAVDPECCTWNDCWVEVKKMIDDYVEAGIVDPHRIYLTGSSDGGTGTWDYAQFHGNEFAAAIALSCGRPRKTDIPIYFFNTASERDYTEEVSALRAEGYTNIQYKHCPEYRHGGDSAECTDELLKEFFSFRSAKRPVQQ